MLNYVINFKQKQEVQDPSFWASCETNGETNGSVLNGVSDHGKVIRHFSVNACLAPVASLHGMSVTTVEGIGSTRYVLCKISQVIFQLLYNKTYIEYQTFFFHF